MAYTYTFALLSGNVPASYLDTNFSEACQRSNNLSDLANASTARTNLGLGDMATQSAASVAITGGTLSAVTISGSTITTPTIAVKDASFSLLANADVTKIAKFDLSALTTATTRTLGVQDVNGTIYVTGGADVSLLDGGTGASLTPATGDSIVYSGSAMVAAPVYSSKNRIINGDMYVDQRNAGAAQTITAAAAVAYTVDRFYASCTGANVTGQQIAGSAPDQFVYRFTGAASVTQILFGQRIEAANIFDLANTTATFSVKLSNSVLTSVTWTAYYANTTDTFSAKTQIATGTFTINSTPTRYSANISLPANAVNGVAIEITVGAQTSGTWTIGEFQLEPGSVMTSFERKPVSQRLIDCYRYFYRKSFANGNVVANLQAFNTTSVFGKLFDFPTPMRAAPNSTMTASNFSAYTAAAAGPNAFTTSSGVTGTITGVSITGSLGGSSGLAAGSCAVVVANTTANIDSTAEL